MSLTPTPPGICVCGVSVFQEPTFLQTLCSWGRCRPLCGASCPPRPPSPCPPLPSEHAGCSGHWGSAWSLRSAATPRSLAPPLSGYLNQGRRSRFRVSSSDFTPRNLRFVHKNEEFCVRVWSMCRWPIPAGLFASSPCVYWTPLCVTEFTVTVWRLGRLTWPVWPRGRVWTGAKVSCWAWPCPWGNWSPWSDWTPWTYRDGTDVSNWHLSQHENTTCYLHRKPLLWTAHVTWKVCHWICPVAVTVWAWMRKVPGLTSCTLCRVWPAAAFRSWPWATWATWAWLSPDSCRMGWEIVVALEDETCRVRKQLNKLQLHTKAEKAAFTSCFYVGGPGLTAQWTVSC